MTPPEDPLPGDNQRGRRSPGQSPDEIDGMGNARRESLGNTQDFEWAARAPEDVGAPSSEALREVELQTVGGDVSVRPGLLAHIRRRTKTFVRREVHLQLDPVADEVSRLSLELQRLQRFRDAEIAEREATVDQLRRELAAASERLSRLERTARSDQGGRKAALQAESRGAIEAPDTSMDLDYFAFEGLLRGSTDEIAERQSGYVDLFADADDILDVGCGRGELIELLSRVGKRVSGVDLNRDMVERCRERGLQVVVADGITNLSAREAQSLGGIAALQVVEHLRPAQLTAFLEGCYRVLRPDGVLLLETINPVTLSAIRNYFADLTHSQPLVPETLKFLVECAGFRDVTITYQNALPEIARLRHVPFGDRVSEGAQAEIDRNVDLVNATLFGPQDYAVIARA